MPLTISNKQARRFLLQKQLLYSAQNLSGLAGIETVFQKLRVIQYDPLNPCGRNADLVLQSRVKNIHPNDYYQWLYSEKKGIDVYDKELCIIPIEDLPFVTHRQLKASEDMHRQTFLRSHAVEISQIMEQIKIQGPISSTDIKIKKSVRSGWGTEANVGRIALEQLWKMGQLVVVKREGMKKFYDLPDLLHPPVILQKLAKEAVLRRLKSVGILPRITTGGGWQGMGPVAKIINQLIKNKSVIEFSVIGSKLTYLVPADDLEALTTVGDSQTLSMRFIAPLDNLIWDRKMIEDLFNFHYRWEVYTPKAKRQFGYYVLPILYGEEFIGRIEPVRNSKTNTLEIRGLWKERSWTTDEEKIFQETLRKFSNYLQTDKIIFT